MANRSLETLEDYKVEWTYVQANKHSPSSELDKYLLLEMCKQAAEGMKMQCGQEYFPADGQEPRAAQLYKMSIEERKNIPTENLATERYLAKFGYLASISASRSNKNFEAKRVHNDLMFSSVESDIEVSRKTESIVKQLQSMEVTWTENQKKQWKEKISKNLQNKQLINDLIDILLKKYKEHGGPVTDMTDLNKLMKQSPKKDLKRFL